MPRKEFESFTRLDAADVNNFLMNQTVQTYGSTSSRDAALPSPLDGQVAIEDGNKNLQVYYDQWRPLPFAMQTGTVNITPVANVATGVAVTFVSGRFTEAPFILATGATSASVFLNASVGGISTTGATIYVLRQNATTTAVNYLVIQMTNPNPIG